MGRRKVEGHKSATTSSEAALAGHRVLDLTDEKGQFCGKILSDLGMDVIKVEKPGGDSSRRIGPFYHDIPHLEKSLFWFFHNTGKRGVTLNLETADGHEIFRRLVSTVDIVLESFEPGYLHALKLAYPDLSNVNPRIIMVSISAFGQDGPYRNFKSSDIVNMAMSGVMYFTGDPDRPPVRVTIPQSYLHAGAHAAVSTLIALYYREFSGEGQYIDLSIQEALLKLPYQEIPFWDLEHFLVRRSGNRVFRTGMSIRDVWDCKDGQVGFRIIGGAYTKNLQALAEWMNEEGKGEVFCDVQEHVKNYGVVDYSKLTQDLLDRWEEAIQAFFLRYTKEELFQEAMERRIFLAPSYDVSDLAKYNHLKERNFWIEVEHDELQDTITYPRAPMNLSVTPWHTRRRAPLIGEHNMDVYGTDLGFTVEELALLKSSGVI